MFGIERMNLSDLDYTPANIIRYPSLEQLTIWEMFGLVEWVEIRNGNFPLLHSLCINRCPILGNIPKFPALVELSVYSCAQFIEAMDLPSLQSLKIIGLQKTKSVRLPKNLVALKKLEFSHCLEPLSIEGLFLLNSLETIIISKCPQLDFNGGLDERQFICKEKGSQSVWSHKEKLDFGGSGMGDEGQELPIVSKKRKNKEDLGTLSSVLAERHKKLKELESQLSMQELEFVDSTVERVVKTVQSSMANLIPAIWTTEQSSLDTNMPQKSHSEPSSPVGTSAHPSSFTGIINDPCTEWPQLSKAPRTRKKSLQGTRIVRSSHLGDGYTWTKYGQKDTLGRKSPRSYFRCVHKHDQGCSATKQVQRLDEDPSIYEITYQGSHTCRLDRELRSAPLNPAYITFSSGTITRSETGVSDLTALGSIDQPSTLAYPLEKMHNTTLSLSLPSSVAISGPVESQAAFSSYNSSFAARSETEGNDITALCSVDSRQAYHSGFGSELDDSE